MTCWIRKEILDGVPELPSRVDFDDWEKERGMVNLLSKKKNSSCGSLPDSISAPRAALCSGGSPFPKGS